MGGGGGGSLRLHEIYLEIVLQRLLHVFVRGVLPQTSRQITQLM